MFLHLSFSLLCLVSEQTEFDTSGCLVISEVRILLEKRERAADNK